MTPATREYLNFFAGLTVSAGIAIGVLTPQLVHARHDRDRLQRNVDDIAAHPGVVVKGNLINYVGKDFRIVAINPRTNAAWVICRVQAKAGPA